MSVGLGDPGPVGDLCYSGVAAGGWAGYSGASWVKHEITACMHLKNPKHP